MQIIIQYIFSLSALVCIRRFSVQDGIAVIPKSSSEPHLVENLQVFDFSLDALQHAALAALSNELGGGQYFDWDPTSIA